MKVINPLGRTLTGNDITPCACYCYATDSNFETGRGPSDSCDNCGCKCSLFTTSDYRQVATSTDRKSYL